MEKVKQLIVEIPVKLHDKLKIEAIKHNMSLKDFCIERLDK